MGNTALQSLVSSTVSQNSEQILWSKQYTLLDKQPLNSTYTLHHIPSNQSYKVKHMALSKTQHSQIFRQIDTRRNSPSPYVIELEKIQQYTVKDYCSQHQEVFLMYKYIETNLKEEILNRRFRNQRFLEGEVKVIMEAGVKAISYLSQINCTPKGLNTSQILLTNDRAVLLNDPWLSVGSILQNSNPKNEDQQQSRILSIPVQEYPSPQKILYQNDLIDQYNEWLSQLFTFGVIVLEVIFMESMVQQFYDKSQKKIFYHKVKEKIEEIRDGVQLQRDFGQKITNRSNSGYELSGIQEIKEDLRRLLSHEPRIRESVYLKYKKNKSTYLFLNKPKYDFTNLNKVTNSPNSNLNNQLSYNYPSEPHYMSSIPQMSQNLSSTYEFPRFAQQEVYQGKKYGQMIQQTQESRTNNHMNRTAKENLNKGNTNQFKYQDYLKEYEKNNSQNRFRVVSSTVPKTQLTNHTSQKSSELNNFTYSSHNNPHNLQEKKSFIVPVMSEYQILNPFAINIKDVPVNNTFVKQQKKPAYHHLGGNHRYPAPLSERTQPFVYERKNDLIFSNNGNIQQSKITQQIDNHALNYQTTTSQLFNSIQNNPQNTSQSFISNYHKTELSPKKQTKIQKSYEVNHYTGFSNQPKIQSSYQSNQFTSNLQFDKFDISKKSPEKSLQANTSSLFATQDNKFQPYKKISLSQSTKDLNNQQLPSNINGSQIPKYSSNFASVTQQSSFNPSQYQVLDFEEWKKKFNISNSVLKQTQKEENSSLSNQDALYKIPSSKDFGNYQYKEVKSINYDDSHLNDKESFVIQSYGAGPSRFQPLQRVQTPISTLHSSNIPYKDSPKNSFEINHSQISNFRNQARSFSSMDQDIRELRKIGPPQLRNQQSYDKKPNSSYSSSQKVSVIDRIYESDGSDVYNRKSFENSLDRQKLKSSNIALNNRSSQTILRNSSTEKGFSKNNTSESYLQTPQRYPGKGRLNSTIREASCEQSGVNQSNNNSNNESYQAERQYPNTQISKYQQIQEKRQQEKRFSERKVEQRNSNSSAQQGIKQVLSFGNSKNLNQTNNYQVNPQNSPANNPISSIGQYPIQNASGKNSANKQSRSNEVNNSDNIQSSGSKLEAKSLGNHVTYYEDGSKFVGQADEQGDGHGYGMLYYSDGRLAYEGNWEHGDFHGKGKLYNPFHPVSEEPYNYKDLTLIDQNLKEFDGYFCHDKRQGNGTLKIHNQEIYHGQFHDDLPHGKGKYYCVDGTVIQGIWQKGILKQII